VRDSLGPGTAVGCGDRRGMTGDGIGLYVGEEVSVTRGPGVSGDVGVYGGGGAGFITTSGGGTARFFSGVTPEEEAAETAGDVGVRGCDARGDRTPSSALPARTMLCDCSNVRS